MHSRAVTRAAASLAVSLLICLAVTVWIASSSLAAARGANENADGFTWAPGGYTVRIPLKDKNLQRMLVERDIEVLALVKGGFLDVLATEKDLDFLMSLGYPVTIIRSPDSPLLGATALDENLGLYHTYAELEAALASLETTYPTLADVSVPGQSGQGRNLSVIKISDNVTVDEDEPEVFFMANNHAREIMTVDIALMFAQYLLTNYGNISDVTDMVNNREIFIMPMSNPDGHRYVELNHSGPSDGWWRKNRRYNYDGSYGVDLNRNYGYMWGYDNNGSSPTPGSPIYRGTAAFSEYETTAIRNFCAGRQFTMGISYHSYGELFLFPWDYALLYTPDHDVFVAMADSLTSGNGYAAGTSPSLLYAVNGGSDDWAYGDTTTKNRFFCFTAEMNNSSQGGFGPAESYIQPTFDLLLPMNMDMLHFADNPYRFRLPERPVQYAIDHSNLPSVYTLKWSWGDPSSTNPALNFDVEEYTNVSVLAQDPADVLTDRWVSDGFSVSGTRVYEGTGSYYGGQVDLQEHTLRASMFYSVTAATDSLRFRTWYATEINYDYAYVEVSQDGGGTWVTVPGNITTTNNPYGQNRGYGITGTSSGWVLAIFPLTAYLGQEIDIRFSYVTDQNTHEEGIYIDVPGPVPTCEARTMAASALPDTVLTIAPDETGAFAYRIRARDAENQKSPWSLSQSITIDNLTGVGDTPVLATRLGANYPNPFNPVTRIPYTVGTSHGTSRAVRVTLAIYNVAGERVATLVDHDVAPGPYEAVWDAKTDNGAPLASGVYFARLTVGSAQALTRKLVLLK